MQEDICFICLKLFGDASKIEQKACSHTGPLPTTCGPLGLNEVAKCSQPLTRPALGGWESPPCGLEKVGTEKVDLAALHNLSVAIAVKSSLGAKVLS